jgi:hypothetical protein
LDELNNITQNSVGKSLGRSRRKRRIMRRIGGKEGRTRRWILEKLLMRV